MIGGPTYFRHTKVIHSTACYANKNGQLFTINLQAGAPYCPSDFFLLQFLRTYSDCIVTTGQILRKEPDCFDTSVIGTIGLKPRVYFEKDGVKPVAIMTNSQIGENLPEVGNQLYANPRFKKHILTKPGLLKHMVEKNPDLLSIYAQHKIDVAGIDGLNLREAIKHL